MLPVLCPPPPPAPKNKNSAPTLFLHRLCLLIVSFLKVFEKGYFDDAMRATMSVRVCEVCFLLFSQASIREAKIIFYFYYLQSNGGCFRPYWSTYRQWTGDFCLFQTDSYHMFKSFPTMVSCLTFFLLDSPENLIDSFPPFAFSADWHYRSRL